MKNILIASLFALTTAASAAAMAAPEHMGKYHDKHMQRMSSELQLTEEQQQELRAVHKEQFGKMKALHEEKQEKVNAILTDEQRGKWQEMREQRREKMKEHMQDRKDRKRGERKADADASSE